MILANSITHTFLNIIPAVYLGAPDAGTALAVLPGHSMLLDGMGMAAIRLSAIGSAGSIIVSLLIAAPLMLFFGRYYDSIRENMGWILLAVVPWLFVLFVKFVPFVILTRFLYTIH